MRYTLTIKEADRDDVVLPRTSLIGAACRVADALEARDVAQHDAEDFAVSLARLPRGACMGHVPSGLVFRIDPEEN